MMNLFVIGDWGRGGTPGQRSVAAGMARVARSTPPDAIVATGDNFYDDGVMSLDDPLWQRAFERIYGDPALAVPWYPVLGNHDHHGNVQAQIDYSAINDQWHLPASYYALELDAGDCSILLAMLDTSALLRCYQAGGIAPMPAIVGTVPEQQIAWLDATLASSRARWKIVVGHHPIWSGSPYHGSNDELRGWLEPVFARHDVHVYFCGHEHDLQHLIHDGVHHVLSGAGAEVRETGRIPQTRFARAELGFVIATVSHAHIQLRFVDLHGHVLHAAHVHQAPPLAAGITAS